MAAAKITGRLPILTVMGAQANLPKVPKQKETEEIITIASTLEVNWARVFGVLGGLLAGQAITILLVLHSCRKVFLPDHASFWPIAKALSIAVVGTGGRSVDTGADLAAHREKEGMRLRYGARKIGIQDQEDVFELSAWDDTEQLDLTRRRLMR
ncbi:hypothetical protein B0T14DRAFT_569195 [Immersiella caudata]|uniref:Uncharacterized protein n=1 Tax=Immersiella caudata TaxID=314043 RepID=A0AA39WLP5_9PEZI|nr:hypothetical protein B0T14DRAFT_569195 [Immersiella caudata]